MSSPTLIVDFLISALLWRACCQSCARDECEDVSDEVVRSNQAHSMLQKNALRRKADATTLTGQLPIVSLGGPCRNHDEYYESLMRGTDTCADIAKLPSADCTKLCRAFLTSASVGVKYDDVCCTSCSECASLGGTSFGANIASAAASGTATRAQLENATTAAAAGNQDTEELRRHVWHNIHEMHRQAAIDMENAPPMTNLDELAVERKHTQAEAAEAERRRSAEVAKKAEADQLEKERLDRVEKERLEQERLEKVHLENERLKKELLEKEDLEQEHLERERQQEEDRQAELLRQEAKEDDAELAANEAAKASAMSMPVAAARGNSASDAIGWTLAANTSPPVLAATAKVADAATITNTNPLSTAATGGPQQLKDSNLYIIQGYNSYDQSNSQGISGKCPPSCRRPMCVEGGKHNGGLPLVDGQCYYHCSEPFSGIRYCGSGSDYITGSSVNCSGCVDSHIMHALDGSSACPSGYEAITDIDKCIAGVTIAGQRYTWSGRTECSHLWPKRGCFSFGSKLYFSTCDDGRPLSMWAHNGICKKQGPLGTTTTTTVATGCPSSCESQNCGMGSKYNGGVPLVNGKCIYHCSQDFSGRRYCGSGPEYTTGGSVDCSGCTKGLGLYLLAPDDSAACPAGYHPLIDIDECKDTPITFAGIQHPWSGRSECSYLWPRGGCFSFGGKLYYSMCGEHRPLSQFSHNGICKKIS